jgi:superoxide dismutase, Fe-Mn family
MTIRDTINLIEEKSQGKLEQIKLPYARTELSPVMSEDTIDYHYGKLYKGYVDRYNRGEGAADFNDAGAYLHSILFSQFNSPSTSKPQGAVLDLINKNYKNFVNFKREFKEEAMTIQGSGWIYLSRSGQIKTIKNHARRADIALLVDWWEHSWALDYQADKAKYLDSIWRIIDWTVINHRL